jgi:hypothetical protein
MISGCNATAELNAAIVLVKLALTGSNSQSGAIARILADSPVPCPDSSASGALAPEATTTGATL